MSYAAKPARLRPAFNGGGSPRGAPEPARAGTATDKGPARRTPVGSPFDETPDWERLLLVGGGIAAGAAIGAGVAMLLTAKTGPERRAGIARRARRFGHRSEQAWEDLAFELREATRAARDRLRTRRHRAAAAEEEVDD